MTLSDDAKVWFQSKTVWGAIIAGIVPLLTSVFKVEFPADFSADLAGQLAGLFGAGLAIYGRIKAVKKIG